MPAAPVLDSPILLDVSRLIWRQWTGRLPTGVDRVCLAYLRHYRSRSVAFVQFRGVRRILGREDSQRLFDLLLSGSRQFRLKLIATLARAALKRAPTHHGGIYLNIGHTGLDSPDLPPWLADHRLKPVFLIHDLIPITHPEYCRAGEDARHRQRMSQALRSASGIIANSEATRVDIAAFARTMNLPMPPCLVALLGVDTEARPEEVGPPACERPYFVMVGTIEARKNHLLMLSVWTQLVRQLGDAAAKLVIIGQRGWEAEAAIDMLDNLGLLDGHVVELGRCDDATMHRLLGGAKAMLLPSHVEGFGLPLVEALQQGVPVIASDLPVFQEIAGDIPTYIDPTDPQQWADSIIEYSNDGPERRRQLAALRGFAAPSWRSHFALVDAFLETI